MPSPAGYAIPLQGVLCKGLYEMPSALPPGSALPASPTATKAIAVAIPLLRVLCKGFAKATANFLQPVGG